ncbi:DoxX family protein [Microbacterium sp. NPDC089696]|uniref:DoxX family protein n=1 Tax=Microbacterium sp. NPDC089696 TaxID=3364199 RepID=UPI0037F1DA1E
MLIAYWIIAGLLAVFHLYVGGQKLARSPQKLADSGMAWAGDFPSWSVKAVGFVEVLGAIGLILPPLLQIAPMLAPWAAMGLALVQVGAALTHLMRKERKAVPVNIVLLLVAAAAAWLGFFVWS